MISKRKPVHVTVIYFLLIAFISSSLYIPRVSANEFNLPFMSKPGVMVNLSPAFTPAYLKGITIHQDNPLKFDFIVYKGDSNFSDQQKQQEYKKLMKYFLASLAVPDDNQWVNLSPYEKSRVIEEDFGRTQMGRDLLAQDYRPKQITSSLIYPEQGLGKKFWNKVYDEAHKRYGKTDIPVSTFNKVWIVPDDAVIYEKSNTAYVIKDHLKVMLEEDYLSLKKHTRISSVIPAEAGRHARHSLLLGIQNTHSLASKIIKEIILPDLEREVNNGKNFANLRQVYSGMLLAAWYKRALKESLLGKIYANQSKLKGVDQDPKANAVIYQRYLEAFKKGVYNYIKEDYDPATQQVMARKYFSGGTTGFTKEVYQEAVHGTSRITPQQDSAMLGEVPQEEIVTAVMEEEPVARAMDRAMSGLRVETGVRATDAGANDLAQSAAVEDFKKRGYFEKVLALPMFILPNRGGITEIDKINLEKVVDVLNKLGRGMPIPSDIIYAGITGAISYFENNWGSTKPKLRAAVVFEVLLGIAIHLYIIEKKDKDVFPPGFFSSDKLMAKFLNSKVYQILSSNQVDATIAFARGKREFSQKNRQEIAKKIKGLTSEIDPINFVLPDTHPAIALAWSLRQEVKDLFSYSAEEQRIGIFWGDRDIDEVEYQLVWSKNYESALKSLINRAINVESQDPVTLEVVAHIRQGVDEILSNRELVETGKKWNPKDREVAKRIVEVIDREILRVREGLNTGTHEKRSPQDEFLAIVKTDPTGAVNRLREAFPLPSDRYQFTINNEQTLLKILELVVYLLIAEQDWPVIRKIMEAIRDIELIKPRNSGWKDPAYESLSTYEHRVNYTKLMFFEILYPIFYQTDALPPIFLEKRVKQDAYHPSGKEYHLNPEVYYDNYSIYSEDGGLKNPAGSQQTSIVDLAMMGKAMMGERNYPRGLATLMLLSLLNSPACASLIRQDPDWSRLYRPEYQDPAYLRYLANQPKDYKEHVSALYSVKEDRVLQKFFGNDLIERFYKEQPIAFVRWRTLVMDMGENEFLRIVQAYHLNEDLEAYWNRQIYDPFEDLVTAIRTIWILNNAFGWSPVMVYLSVYDNPQDMIQDGIFQSAAVSDDPNFVRRDFSNIVGSSFSNAEAIGGLFRQFDPLSPDWSHHWLALNAQLRDYGANILTRIIEKHSFIFDVNGVFAGKYTQEEQGLSKNVPEPQDLFQRSPHPEPEYIFEKTRQAFVQKLYLYYFYALVQYQKAHPELTKKEYQEILLRTLESVRCPWQREQGAFGAPIGLGPLFTLPFSAQDTKAQIIEKIASSYFVKWLEEIRSEPKKASTHNEIRWPFLEGYSIQILEESKQEVKVSMNGGTPRSMKPKEFKRVVERLNDMARRGNRRAFNREFNKLMDKAVLPQNLKAIEPVTQDQSEKTPFGGIDFNATNLKLQIKRDGKGVPLPISQQNLEQIKIDGLTPVIINIQPAMASLLLSKLQISGAGHKNNL